MSAFGNTADADDGGGSWLRDIERAEERKKVEAGLPKTPLARMHEATPSRVDRIRELEQEAKRLRAEEEADTKAWAERLVRGSGWSEPQLCAVFQAARARINELANDDE